MDQRYRIPPLAMLNAFTAFARTGGIRRAAAELRVDHAAISRHIRDLENILGTPLRDKETGTLTLAGHTYYSRITPLLEELATATADIRNHTPPLPLPARMVLRTIGCCRDSPPFGARTLNWKSCCAQ